MHLISTIPGGWNPNDEGVFHIDQSPGDIIFLSAADTDLFMMNKAYHKLNQQNSAIPSLRMANLTYFKQELTIDIYLEEVVTNAKIVVLKLLGGKAYFNYLCEAIEEFCKDRAIPLIFLPGDNKPDLELMQSSSIPLKSVNLVWSYLTAGGIQNCTAALEYLISQVKASSFTPQKVVEIPDLFFYHPSSGIVEGDQTSNPDAHIFTYRSYFLADNLKPIDVLIEQLESQGIYAVAMLSTGYREDHLKNQVLQLLNRHNFNLPKVILNATGFSIQGFNESSHSGLLNEFNVPVLQVIMAGTSYESWKEGSFGLPPTDIAMNIALPEVDGKIITKVISFKESSNKDSLTDSEVVSYVPNKEGCEWAARFAKAWIHLQQTPNSQKKVALVLPNYPNKNSRLANGVGLDTPKSTIAILNSLQSSGYSLGEKYPKDTEELIHQLTDSVTNSLASINTLKATKSIRLNEQTFFKHYNQISPELRSKIENQWGPPNESPFYQNGTFLIPGFVCGNVFLSIQPSRGYNLDLQASYHSPDLPPPYAYLAYYIWLQHEFNADAIVHVGKHGNLEWLPGKSVALSEQTCFPSILGPLPHFYPFIINDPGEGTQAKRRTQAVILDHLIPPMTRAENHGELLKLELLIDEFYESALVDKRRAGLLKKKIEKLVNETHLRADLNDDGKDIDKLLQVIDGYLCELKEAQIRGGLHIFGQHPKEEKLVDLIVALHRLPQHSFKGITQCISEDAKLNFDPLNVDYTKPCEVKLFGLDCRTYGQAVELLEHQSKSLIQDLLNETIDFDNQPLLTKQLLLHIQEHTLPTLKRTEDELLNLIHGLNGRYVPSGGSGAPTRGRLDILPTGRNFYSVDVRTIPSEAAYELGQKSAQNIIDRYLQENGKYPTSIGLSVWGTSTMRTGGDDIAQAFALMGVRPIWQGINRRVKDFEVISTLELRRPRIDVMLRISGFFRDAFPDIISLFNAAVEKIASLDESQEQNPIKARVDREQQEWLEQGLTEKQATERSLYRVFGSKPGAYGAGLQGLIDGKNWTTSDDLAQAYINWSGYAYFGRQNEGKSAHETFEKRLTSIEVVLQNQDNREHDLLDSDDYYQFQGGMTSAVNKLSGKQPSTYFGDHSRPENPRIKSLKEELLKVFRSRVTNPKWIKGMQEHGYKGAFEMAATMDYLFAYDATTHLIEDFMYQDITEKYLFDPDNNAFIKQHNPWALRDMSERMLEAIQRDLWKTPSKETISKLEQLYLDSDNSLE